MIDCKVQRRRWLLLIVAVAIAVAAAVAAAVAVVAPMKRGTCCV